MVFFNWSVPGPPVATERLPVPGKVDQKGHSVHAAIGAGVLQCMDDEEARRFTSSEVLLYQHAQDQLYVNLYTV